jgi:SAM-dependent methyltransferase
MRGFFMKALFLKNRKKINNDLDFNKRKFISPATLIDSETTPSMILKYAKGRCIDIGCGDAPLQNLIESQTECYHTLDIESRIDTLTYTSDICNMNVVKDRDYDFALCLQVLEHVYNPFTAMKEINRILTKNGILILSVPHLSRLHEEPHDYYRYTKYGLQYLASNSGFKVISITPAGGLFCFLGHQLSTCILLPLWHIPILNKVAYYLNKWLVAKPICYLDKKVDKNKIFALGYTCVLQKYDV